MILGKIFSLHLLSLSSPSQFFFETVRVEESVEILSFDPSFFFQKKSKREKKGGNVAESKQEDPLRCGNAMNKLGSIKEMKGDPKMKNHEDGEFLRVLLVIHVPRQEGTNMRRRTMTLRSSAKKTLRTSHQV